jgi:chromosome segregation ATPase
MTLGELIDRLEKSIGHGDLPEAFRNQLTSLREQQEAAEEGLVELNARIIELHARTKELERIRKSSQKSKADSREQRAKLSRYSLSHSVRPVFDLWRRRSH